MSWPLMSSELDGFDAEALRELLDERLAEPPSRDLVRGIKAFGFTALTVGLLLVVLIIYAMVFAYR